MAQSRTARYYTNNNLYLISNKNMQYYAYYGEQYYMVALKGTAAVIIAMNRKTSCKNINGTYMYFIKKMHFYVQSKCIDT